MALEELIVAWSRERQAWQREVMRRIAAGDIFSDEDYDRLASDIIAAKDVPDAPSVSNSFRKQRPKIRPFVLFRLRNRTT